ncbi:hypothetical protein EVAR_63378_1 [Eumeta japonica]|uniref:Uncharacterized protein n=1 Tax=Eumeta variegata TaxID=151549 RepID=A0A4C1YVL3_EUMVA|nr:hypothetical protein EVAR_63378_1 [Eumeta japonica]
MRFIFGHIPLPTAGFVVITLHSNLPVTSSSRSGSAPARRGREAQKGLLLCHDVRDSSWRTNYDAPRVHEIPATRFVEKIRIGWNTSHK